MTEVSGIFHLLETKVSSEDMVRGSFLHARRDIVALPDGNHATREYVVHPGAVMVVPLLEIPGQDLQVVLERQYRYPVQRVMIEFPAGKLDAGESTAHCAQRELFEETGYRASEWSKAGVIHPVIAYSTEFIEVWFAKGLVAGERKLDKGEFLDVFTATANELIAWCLDGRVTDAKTVAAALWLQGYQAGTWKPVWSSSTAN
ncbi:NUDIX hydrolase [Rhodoferax mekongensis]|uniref:NUDIX hydrolase n=1 Tax=Rhodoferax mekongensis TaxID=3068341 RepID=UPI0028BDD292|nr:NUDIX hydrolase [Rhodoferax sp. TBRC 17199]MDT7514944.1 NUDIX hydrolase [Rhodoferax sp. TBRC 17199]